MKENTFVGLPHLWTRCFPPFSTPARSMFRNNAAKKKTRDGFYLSFAKPCLLLAPWVLPSCSMRQPGASLFFLSFCWFEIQTE